MEYADPGAGYDEEKDRAKVLQHLHRRVDAFGFTMQEKKNPTIAIGVS